MEGWAEKIRLGKILCAGMVSNAKHASVIVPNSLNKLRRNAVRHLYMVL